MAYYSVLIISKGGLSRYGFQEYEAESVYFGEEGREYAESGQCGGAS